MGQGVIRFGGSRSAVPDRVVVGRGLTKRDIAATVGCSADRGQVAGPVCRSRAGQFDEHRPGRTATVDQSKVIAATSKPPPKSLGGDALVVAAARAATGLHQPRLRRSENAVALSVDEKSQIQALNQTQKVLPMQPGHARAMYPRLRRNGTTTLFAALEITTWKLTGQCKQRHRHAEFLACPSSST